MNRNDELEINAFVDGELGPGQQAEWLEAMRVDTDLAREVCRRQNLKAQVRLACQEPPRAPRIQRRPRAAGWRGVAASIAMLALGVLSGWIMHTQVGGGSPERFVLLDSEGRGRAPAQADSKETRIVFHLTNPDQAVAGELLDDIEQMLAAYRAQGETLRVEVVSHGDGLGLLRSRLSRHKDRINALAERYANLTFVACRNTMERLRVEKGIEVRLVPEAEVTESGVSHVVRRQQEGWAYIRV